MSTKEIEALTRKIMQINLSRSRSAIQRDIENLITKAVEKSK